MKRRIKRPLFLVRRPNIPIIEKTEIPFFISYMVNVVYMILSTTLFLQYIISFWKPVFVFCIGMLALSELIRNGLTWKNIITVGCILLLFLNILRVGQGLTQNAVAVVFFYMFCSRDISFTKISWVTMLVSGITLAIVVGSSYLGIIPNYVDSGERPRQYLGFLYALYAPTLMSNITLLWIHSKKEKITVKGVVFYFLLNLYFFQKTNSRLCFYMTVLMLLFSLYLRQHERFMLHRKLLCTGMVLSFLGAAGLSFFLTISYKPSVSWMSLLNGILGGRFSLGRESLSQIGMNPFGIQGINWVGNGLNMLGEKNTTETYLYVDNYYIQIAQRFGYVFLIIVLMVSTIACYKAYKNKNIYLLSIFCLLAIHFIIDNLYMYLEYNTFWLAVGMLVFGRRTQLVTMPKNGPIIIQHGL